MFQQSPVLLNANSDRFRLRIRLGIYDNNIRDNNIRDITTYINTFNETAWPINILFSRLCFCNFIILCRDAKDLNCHLIDGRRRICLRRRLCVSEQESADPSWWTKRARWDPTLYRCVASRARDRSAVKAAASGARAHPPTCSGICRAAAVQFRCSRAAVRGDREHARGVRPVGCFVSRRARYGLLG